MSNLDQANGLHEKGGDGGVVMVHRDGEADDAKVKDHKHLSG